MLNSLFSFFFFNDTATTEIYTLSLHDALPISMTHPVATSAAPNLAQALVVVDAVTVVNTRLAGSSLAAGINAPQSGTLWSHRAVRPTITPSDLVFALAGPVAAT